MAVTCVNVAVNKHIQLLLVRSYYERTLINLYKTKIQPTHQKCGELSRATLFSLLIKVKMKSS